MVPVLHCTTALMKYTSTLFEAAYDALRGPQAAYHEMCTLLKSCPEPHASA